MTDQDAIALQLIQDKILELLNEVDELILEAERIRSRRRRKQQED